MLALCASPSPAAAINLSPVKKVCGVAKVLSGLLGKACDVLQGGRLVKAGGKLLEGKPGAAAKTLVGDGTRVAGAALGFAAIGAWVLGGAKAALHEVEKEIGQATSPRLQSTWFSSTYWRVAGLAALLTLPFLFAAALQSLIRSDLSLLARAAFGYLPLALLAVSIAAPLTMLVLAASDEMCAVVSSVTGGAGVGFLQKFGGIMGGLSVVDGSPFLAFLLGALLAGAALAVSLELLVREAAVYVVVLMLPLAFAGMVWPARRIWAVRALETLVALILSKFVIVAVLALAGGALGAGGPSEMFAGTALVMLAAFSPLVLFRLLPFAELAAGASGALRGESARVSGHVDRAAALSDPADLWAASTTDGMRNDAELSASAAADGVSDTSPRADAAGRSAQNPVPRALLDPPAAPAGAPAEKSQAQRLPGMEPHWQAADGEWGTLEFGPGSWPSAPLQPHVDEPSSTGGEPPGDAGQDVGPPPPTDGELVGHGGHDAGPLPPEQESEDGRL